MFSLHNIARRYFPAVLATVFVCEFFVIQPLSAEGSVQTLYAQAMAANKNRQDSVWPTDTGARYPTEQFRRAGGRHADDLDLPPPVGWRPDESFVDNASSSSYAEMEYGSTEFESIGISSQKPGVFQRFTFTETWFSGSRSDGVGINEVELYATFALPLPTPDHPLLITPGFETIFLDGPLTPDLPGQVYSAYMQFLWVPRINERWTAFLAINPGLYGDYETSTDAFRLLGRGLARYDWIPGQLQLMFGVLILDRDDYSLLPAGGLIWTPSDDVRFDIMFPQPKFAYRFSCSDVHEDWLYLSGEFGGDTWAVRRASGADDRITMRDLRLILGVERKFDGGAGIRFEIGYVFSRTIEYASATPDINLDGALMMRGGFSF